MKCECVVWYYVVQALSHCWRASSSGYTPSRWLPGPQQMVELMPRYQWYRVDADVIGCSCQSDSDTCHSASNLTGSVSPLIKAYPQFKLWATQTCNIIGLVRLPPGIHPGVHKSWTSCILCIVMFGIGYVMLASAICQRVC